MYDMPVQYYGPDVSEVKGRKYAYRKQKDAEKAKNYPRSSVAKARKRELEKARLKAYREQHKFTGLTDLDDIPF